MDLKLRANLVTQRQFRESSRYLKDSLCFYEKESDDELELSELVEAFTFSVFDFEKSRSDFDYLISEVKETFHAPQAKSRRRSSQKPQKQKNKNFEIFTVDEVSSRCEDDVRSGSLSKKSRQTGIGGNFEDNFFISGMNSRKRSRDSYKMVVISNQSFEHKKITTSNSTSPNMFGCVVDKERSFSHNQNERKKSLDNNKGGKQHLKEVKGKWSLSEKKKNLGNYSISEAILEVDKRVDVPENFGDSSDAVVVGKVTPKVNKESRDEQYNSPEEDKKRREEQESDDQTTFQVKIDQNLDIKIKKVQQFKVTNLASQYKEDVLQGAKDQKTSIDRKFQDLRISGMNQKRKSGGKTAEEKSQRQEHEDEPARSDRKGYIPKSPRRVKAFSNYKRGLNKPLVNKSSGLKTSSRIPKLDLKLKFPKIKLFEKSKDTIRMPAKALTSRKPKSKTSSYFDTSKLDQFNIYKTTNYSRKTSPRGVVLRKEKRFLTRENSKNNTKRQSSGQNSKVKVSEHKRRSRSSTNSRKLRGKIMKKFEMDEPLAEDATIRKYDYAQPKSLDFSAGDLSNLRKDKLKKNRRRMRKNSLISKLRDFSRGKRSLRNSQYSLSRERTYDKSNDFESFYDKKLKSMTKSRLLKSKPNITKIRKNAKSFRGDLKKLLRKSKVMNNIPESPTSNPGNSYTTRKKGRKSHDLSKSPIEYDTNAKLRGSYHDGKGNKNDFSRSLMKKLRLKNQKEFSKAGEPESLWMQDKSIYMNGSGHGNWVERKAVQGKKSRDKVKRRKSKAKFEAARRKVFSKGKKSKSRLRGMKKSIPLPVGGKTCKKARSKKMTKPRKIQKSSGFYDLRKKSKVSFITPKSKKYQTKNSKVEEGGKRRVRNNGGSLGKKKRKLSFDNSNRRNLRSLDITEFSELDLKKKVTCDIGNFFGVKPDDQDNLELADKILDLIKEFKQKKAIDSDRNDNSYRHD